MQNEMALFITISEGLGVFHVRFGTSIFINENTW
jgi:hypothetical protein